MSARTITGLIGKSKKIHVVVHCQPDGDTIGCAVALKQALGSKRCSIVSKDPIPEIFQKILGVVTYQQTLTGAKTILILDTTELHRTGFENELKLLKEKGAHIGVIDHHKNGNLHRIADCMWHNVDAAATTEIVFELIEQLRLPINRKIATALLLGLYTDTGGFTHSNTSSRSLTLAAKLVSYGANLAQITETLAPKRTTSQVKLWGYAMSNLKISSEGFAIAKINNKAFLDSQASQPEVAGLATWLSTLEGARAALVLIETGSGWRGTMRTHDKALNLSAVAKLLGGKGTRLAAGFLATDRQISGTIKDAF